MAIVLERKVSTPAIYIYRLYTRCSRYKLVIGIKISYKRTSEILADILTKSLNRNRHCVFFRINQFVKRNVLEKMMHSCYKVNILYLYKQTIYIYCQVIIYVMLIRTALLCLKLEVMRSSIQFA